MQKFNSLILSHIEKDFPTRLSCPIILQTLPIRLSCNKVLESRELENAFKSHSCSSRNFVEKRGIRIPGASTKAFLISFSGLNCVIEEGSQHAIMYVALEAESNTISPSEMNRSEGTFLNFYAICCSQAIRITRCERIRNHERLVN